MSFDKLLPFVISTVMAAAAVGKIDTLQRWIWRAQAQVLYESRSSAWGSPKIFKAEF